MTQIHQHCTRSSRLAAGPFTRFFRMPAVWSATALFSIHLYSMPTQADLLVFTSVAPNVAPAQNLAPATSTAVAAKRTPRKAGKPMTANDEQLQFTRAQPSSVPARVQAGNAQAGRTQAVATPRVQPERVQAAPLVVDSREEVPGVSALATAALPPRLAARKGLAPGPSEVELREMFFRAIQAAAERSPQVQRAQAEYEAAEADVDEAKGQRWPQVDIGTQSKAAQFGSGSENESGGSGGVNLNVITPIYDWGRISKTIDSRKYLSKAASSGIEAELESSAYDVTTTMVELGKQRIIIDISQQFVNRMDELVKMLAGIVAVDKGRASELTQAKARLLQAQAARDTAQTRARDAEINLRKLVGERPLMIPRTKEWNIRLANLDALLGRTEDHPTIHQAKAQTESAELQAQVVRSSSLPQLNWVISKTTADDALGREQPWQTSLSVTWGAFRGGSSRASERAALQRAEASRQETEQQRLDLEYRIRTADHDARTLLERAELYRDLTVESERIRLAFYEQWYHLGKRTLLDVLTAENDHYGNQVSEITNRFDGYQAIFRQYAGAGALTGWLRGSQQ
ncbi:TolC family protein [Pseudomonas sp. 22526]|uniref:TolC family protein n=1 Tax=Pseudomonas sp. 22526 TaxID=3453937 RepID=UPI003F84FAFE